MALVEPDSHMAAFIRDNDLGVVPVSGSPEDVADALSRFLTDKPDPLMPDSFQSQGEILKEWSLLIDGLPA